MAFYLLVHRFCFAALIHVLFPSLSLTSSVGGVVRTNMLLLLCTFLFCCVFVRLKNPHDEYVEEGKGRAVATVGEREREVEKIWTRMCFSY